MFWSLEPEFRGSAPATTCRPDAPAEPSQFWTAEMRSAALGISSGIPACGRTRTCTHSATASGRGGETSRSRTARRSCSYIRDTAEAYGIDRRIKFRHRVTQASWSSADALWTLDVEVGADRLPARYTCQFLYLCTGYFDYDAGYMPTWPDMDQFRGHHSSAALARGR